MSDFHDRIKRKASQAASQGHEAATFRVGLFHWRGLGCAVDQLLASKYFLAAAKLGNLQAMRQMAEIMETGIDGLPRDIDAAFVWWQDLALLGDRTANRHIIRLMCNGVANRNMWYAAPAA